MSDFIYFIDAGPSGEELADVAAKVFQALGINDWEERFSTNYPPDEHYYAGYTLNAEVILYDSDDDRMPDYLFRISVERASCRVGQEFLVTDPREFAELLASSGFKVFIPEGAWFRTDWDMSGKIYTV